MLIKNSLVKTFIVIILLFQVKMTFGQYVTNGDAVNIGNDCYRLTTTIAAQEGSIFSTSTIDLASPFTLSGSFNFGNLDGTGADGITFLFANSNTALGTGGGGLGYEGIIPSFVVEFDTWQNAERDDPVADHVGIQQNGSSDHGTVNNLAGPIQLSNLEDGNEHCFSLDWNPTTQFFSMTLDGITISYIGDVAAIFGGNSNVYYGFTSSTGGSVNEHVVCFTTPQITPMPDITICAGETAQLQADAGGINYTWLFDPTLSATNISNPTATPFGTTTYFVQIDFNCAPPQFDDVTVTVLPGPTFTPTYNGPVCIGNTLQLSASGGVTYQWSGPNGFTSGFSSPAIPNATAANGGPYNVTVTDANGCSSEGMVFVLMLPAEPAIIQVPQIPLCQGSSAFQLTATPDMGTWGGNVDVNGNFDPTGLAPGSYNVTYNSTDVNGCPSFDEESIEIVASPTASIDPILPVCEGDDLTLFGNGGGDYFWSGPNGFNPMEQNPTLFSIEVTDAGTYNLTVVDASGCTDTESIEVIVNPAPVVTIDPLFVPICQSFDPIQMIGNPVGGTWGGAANIDGIVDPEFLPEGLNSVTYLFDNGSGCVAMDEIFIDIVMNPEVLIVPAGSFCDTDDAQVLEGDPVGGIWGGEASPTGEFHPGNLGEGNWEVTYSFTDGNGCDGETSIFIEVLPGTTPQILSDDPFCQSDDPQLLTGTPTGGIWGGIANASGQIIPANLSGGMHEVTYSVTPQGGCAGMTSILIEILENPTATISGMGTICAGSNNAVVLTINATGAQPIEVTYAIDGVVQPSIIISTGMNGLPATEAGTYTIMGVTDNNDCIGNGFGSAEVEVVDAPQIQNFETTCDIAQENYTVTFEIIGGDPTTYDVTGSISGMLVQSTNTIFTSDPIPSGSSYDFAVFDANACDTILLSGSFSCACVTDAGTMNLDPINICEDEMVTAIHNNDENLDASDLLFFVLHNGNGNSLGTIFDEQLTPTFSLLPSMMTGVTYYISAVAGDDDGFNGVIFNDPCISISFGTPVQWQALPDGNLVDNAEICDGEEATIIFNLTGTAPFDVIYAVNNINDTLQNIFDGHSLTVTPSITTTYNLLEITDSGPATCQNTSNSTITITVNELYALTETAQICEGESILLGGAMQTLSGIYTDSLSTVEGCDSIIMTTLIVNTIDTIYLTDTDCNMANVGVFVENLTNENNCDSVVILTVSFSDTDTTLINSPTCDPMMVGDETMTFITPEGCDSVVIETFFLVQSDTTLLADTTCNVNNAGVFETVLMNQNLCDSTIILTVAFVPLDTTFLQDITCNPMEAGIFNNTVLTSEGCDSVIVETIILLSSDTTELTDTSCDPNNVGVFQNVQMNQFGCDSTIILTVLFSDADTTYTTDTTCDPMLAGVFTETLITPEGCDSVIIETVSLLQSDTTELTDISCNPNDVGVFQNVEMNQFGCDSTVILTVNFVPLDTTFVSNSTCDPMLAGVFTSTEITAEDCDSIIVETVLLNPSDMTEISDTSCDPNDVGVFENLLINQFGCDSLVIETITLLQSDTIILPLTSCEPADTGTVIVILLNQFGCDSMVVSITSLLPPNECGVEGSLSGSLINCEETTGNLTLEVTLGQGPFTYEWTGPNMGMGIINNLNELIDIPNLAAGSYTVEITDDNGFTTILTTEIEQIFSPNANAEILIDISCFNEMDGSAIGSASGGQFPYTYEWSTNESTPEIDNLFPGTYVVTVTDTNDCTDEASVSLSEPDALEMAFTISNIDCFESNEGSVGASLIGGMQPYQFSINGSEFQDNATFIGLAAGAYEVVAQDANGCTISETILINAPVPLEVDLGDDILIDIGESVQLNALINYPLEAIDTLVWTNLDSSECPSCPIQILAPVITTTFNVTVEADNGCSDTDNLTIYVNRQKEIFAPNVFSPNGDGDNDIFLLFAKDNTVENIKSFLIFNRWGESVHSYFDFQPNNPDFGWDGKHKGRKLNPAVFVWFAEVEFRDGVIILFEGDVTLVR